MSAWELFLPPEVTEDEGLSLRVKKPMMGYVCLGLLIGGRRLVRRGE